MKKFFTYLIFIVLLIVIGLKLYSNVVAVGTTLRDNSIYLEIGYYVLCAFLFYVLILRPVIIIMFAPYYSVAKYCDENDKNNQGIRGKANRLLKKGNLKEEDAKSLKEALSRHGSESDKVLAQRMYIIYNNQIKKNIDDFVVESARDTLILTAVSQSRFVDMLVVLVNNFRMIKRIIVMCGFRPTFLRTLKLFSNVFFSSLVADGIQQIEISTLLSSSITGVAKYVTDSASNGILNAIFMLRMGMLTKLYLYADDPKKMKITLKNSAMAEALRLFPAVITSVITSPIKKVFSLFKPAPKEDQEPEEELPVVKWGRRKKATK